MANSFAESVLERLAELGRGTPELIVDHFDNENFGNAAATIELDGLRLHIVRDRGDPTVEVGLQIFAPIGPLVHPSLEEYADGHGQPTCPLEALAVALNWTRMEELAEHYGLVGEDREYESGPPPGPFLTFDDALGLLREHWDELTVASQNHDCQLRAGGVVAQLRELLMTHLDANEQRTVHPGVTKLTTSGSIAS